MPAVSRLAPDTSTLAPSARQHVLLSNALLSLPHLSHSALSQVLRSLFRRSCWHYRRQHRTNEWHDVLLKNEHEARRSALLQGLIPKNQLIWGWWLFPLISYSLSFFSPAYHSDSFLMGWKEISRKSYFCHGDRMALGALQGLCVRHV